MIIIDLKKISAIFFFTAFLSANANAQFNVRDTIISFPMIGVSAAYQFPGGDLADRFGNNFNVGGVFQWKLHKNWIAGLEYDFIFSDNVKENHILDKYMTPDGNIIDGNGIYSTVTLAERGFKLQLKGGKIFPFIGPNKNSGLMTTLGVGFLQHRILIDTPGNPIPYLEKDYRDGYDRLTNGLSLTEFLGYMQFSNSKFVNFYAGFELTQAFTKNKRAINFDTGLHDGKSRLDLFFGFRVGWVLPLYRRSADKLYFN